MSTYELRYFSIRARAETIKLLLLASGAKFNHVTPEWPADKPNHPMCQLPVLIETLQDGSKFELSDTQAIEKYLAAKAGLLVDSGLRDTARESQLRGQIEDLFLLLTSYPRGPEGIREFTAQRYGMMAPAFVKYHEDILAKNGYNGHYFGSKTTYVDLALYTFMAFNCRYAESNTGIPDCIKFFAGEIAPGINKVLETVQGDPAVAPYLASLEQ